MVKPVQRFPQFILLLQVCMAYFGRRNRNDRHQNIFDFCYDVVDDW